MQVSQLLKDLSYGPLSNLSISNNGDGTLKADRLPAILSYINDGMLRLYSRFNLSEKELIIQLVEGKTDYLLDSRFSQSRHDEFPGNPAYIIDEFDPFEDDLIQVLQVQRAGGTVLALNDEGNDLSLYTPRVNVLQVPRATAGVPLFITYQAAPKKLVLADMTNEAATLDIPLVLEAALQSFIAHKVLSHMNGQEHSAKASEHLLAYEGTCKDVEDKDLVNSTQAHTNIKFHNRGFV